MLSVKDEAARAQAASLTWATNSVCDVGGWKAVPSILTTTESEWATGLRLQVRFP